MGIFSKKNKSKESTLVKGKSKKGFHFRSIFKSKNKKNIKKQEEATDNKLPKEQQGYCFVSYSKSLTIRPALSDVNDDKPINTNELEDHELKNTVLNENLKKTSNDVTLKEDKNSSELQLNPPNIPEQNINTVPSRPKHQSTLSQFNDFLNSCQEQDITFTSGSYLVDKSTFLSMEEQNTTQNIEESKLIEIEPSQNVTQEKDKNSDNIISTEMNTSSSEDKPLIINNNNNNEEKNENITKSDGNGNDNGNGNIESEEKSIKSKNSNSIQEIQKDIQEIHEKRKRENSRSSNNSSFSQGLSVATNQQQKKIKKDENKGRKDPNFVKNNNNKKRMGIITRKNDPYIQDNSIVQGVKGPWKIVETTTLTTGIATSPEIIHQTFGNGVNPSLSNSLSSDIIFHTSTLPSLTTNSETTLNNNNISIINSGHQIVQDSLIADDVQKTNSPTYIDGDLQSLSDGESDISNDNDNNSHYSTPSHKSEHVINENEINNHDIKDLNVNSMKENKNKNKNQFNRYNTDNISSTTTNTNNNDNEIKNEINSIVTPILTTSNTDLTVSPNNDSEPVKINNDYSMTTDLKVPNQSSSFTLFQDTSNGSIDQKDSSNILFQNSELPKESENSNSRTVIKFKLSKPSYLENGKDMDTQWKSKDLSNTKWNNRVTLESRYFLNSNSNDDDNRLDSTQEECYLENVKCILEHTHKPKDTQQNSEIWVRKSKNTKEEKKSSF